MNFTSFWSFNVLGKKIPMFLHYFFFSPICSTNNKLYLTPIKTIIHSWMEKVGEWDWMVKHLRKAGHYNGYFKSIKKSQKHEKRKEFKEIFFRFYSTFIYFFIFFCFFAKNHKFVIFSGLLHKKLKIVQLLLLKRWLPNQSWRLTILLKILDEIIVVEVIGLFTIILKRQLKNANKGMKKHQ